ncbi:MAG: FecR domain-containing protein [Verrucomicrobia bacterium]|nr:FecR domain-containing protein [Verrucomicrobiota bacterium]
MNHPHPTSPGGQDIDRLAAEWALRERAGLSRRDRRALDDWLQAPAHAAAFAELKLTSDLLDGLREPPAKADAAEGKHRIYWLAAALAAAAAIAVILSVPRPTPPAHADVYVQSASTEVGGLKNLTLPDGSVIGLNTDSAVEIAYSANERRIRLTRGEAFFTVAKNPQRPFWVEAGQVSLRAVGTAFNVRYRPEAVEVLVREGKVQVTQSRSARPEPLLVAGDKALVPLSVGSIAGRVTVAPVEPARLQSALAWQNHRLEFADTPLAEVVAEFNRYNRHQLVIEDATLSAQTFGGAFAASGYGSLVEVLEQSFGVVAERRSNVTILRKAR